MVACGNGGEGAGWCFIRPRPEWPAACGATVIFQRRGIDGEVEVGANSGSGILDDGQVGIVRDCFHRPLVQAVPAITGRVLPV